MRRFERLLAVIRDPMAGPEAQHALNRATEVAEENGAQLTLLAAPERLAGLGRLFSGDKRRLEGLVEEGSRERLEDLAGGPRDRGIDTRVAVRAGRLEDAVAEETAAGDHDLCFVDVRRETGPLRRALGGSTELRLLRGLEVPVFLARPPTAAPGRVPMPVARGAARDEAPPAADPGPAILAAIDAGTDDPVGQALAHRALEVAEDLATRGAGRLYATYAWNLPGESILRRRIPDPELEEMLEEARSRAARALEDAVDEALGEAARRVGRRLMKGYPWDTIPTLVDELSIDVLVIGSVARSGLGRALLGNTAEGMLGLVPCSLLVLRPPPGS